MKKKILLIEDNEDIRNNTAEILELSNYTVITAENGKKGVVEAIKNEPDLIICDIMMPELDGYGVLHAIQKNEKIRNTPFIFLTAMAERNDLRKGMQLGADDYLTKPFDGTELLDAVDSRLKKMEMLKEDINPDLDGLRSLQATSGLKALGALTEDRNINHYKKKQLLYSEGNHPNRLYYLLKGKVKVFKSNENGKELVTDVFAMGDFVGHIALLEKSVYKDSAEVIEDSEVAIIPKEDFDDLIDKNPMVARKFIQLLAKNVSEKENQLLRVAYDSLRRKVADALILIQSKYHQAGSKSCQIDISRENLATMAGTATESLIRTLGDFKNEKLIDMEAGKISIIDSKRLQNLAN